MSADSSTPKAKPRRKRQNPGPGYANFLIRIPKPLLAKAKRFAVVSRRSATAEIVFRLSESLEGQSIDEHGVIVVHSSVPLK